MKSCDGGTGRKEEEEKWERDGGNLMNCTVVTVGAEYYYLTLG